MQVLKRILRLISLGFFLVIPLNLAHADDKQKTKTYQHHPILKALKNIKKCVIFLGTVDGQGVATLNATSFLIRFGETFYLVTAKHVIANPHTGEVKDENIYAFINLLNGQIAARKIVEIKKQFGVQWIFHPNPQVDIAMMPFGLDPKADDVKVIPESLFLSSKEIFELYDVFFLSYQPGIRPQRALKPVIRVGAISLKHDDGTFYIDAFAFPGSSGSPVFIKPSPIRYAVSGGLAITRENMQTKFIGMIGEYLPYTEVAISAQTSRPRVIFEENTGLSRVWSVDFIKEILQSEAFKEQHSKIDKGAVRVSFGW